MCDTTVRFESPASHMYDIIDYLYVYKLITNYQLLLFPLICILYLSKITFFLKKIIFNRYKIHIRVNN